jgi:hypothetical protein
MHTEGQRRRDDETYLDDDSDSLDEFEFLTMAEAGEVGHCSLLETMSTKAANNPAPDISARIGSGTTAPRLLLQKGRHGELTRRIGP